MKAWAGVHKRRNARLVRNMKSQPVANSAVLKRNSTG